MDLAATFSENQDRPTGESGTNSTRTVDNTLEAQNTHDGQIPSQVDLSNLEPVRHAAENGRVKGTITTEYQETTITEGHEFSSSKSWSEATAVNSAHAADLRFTYRILNDGTDILRVMDGLMFNIYLGGDPNPIFTYNVILQTGTLSNLQPGQSVTFGSNPVPLSLQHLAKIDQGASVLITVEYLAYGGDQVFFEDAINGGLIVGIDDGWADGNETMDMFILPCFGIPCGIDPNETIQTILQRGFSTTEDEDGSLLSISTPEVDGTQVTWVNHPLTYNSWWNIYYSDNLNYTGSISTTLPAAGEAIVIRILDDTDLDGFNDRTEERLGTDPEDSGSHPTPEFLAGTVSERTNNQVKVILAFENIGIYDASGVQVIAYAPDDSITLSDNVIGGSGRVSAGSSVVLGGTIRKPVLSTGWSGTAVPNSSGQYQGTVDRTYTFTALSSGNIGSGNLLYLTGRMAPILVKSNLVMVIFPHYLSQSELMG